MDLLQVWHDAITNVTSTISNDREKAIYRMIEIQCGIRIVGNDLYFICNNDFMLKLMTDYGPMLYVEILRLIGNDTLGSKVMLAQEFNESQLEGKNSINPVTSINEDRNEPSAMPSSPVQNSYVNSGMSSGLNNEPAPFTANPYPDAMNQQASSVNNSNTTSSYDVINPNKTFENYVTDPENELVYAIAQKIAKDPGSESFNPFYVYGESGLGKTHLLWAIANRLRATKPNISVVYIRAEEFIRRYVASMSKTNDRQNVKFQDTFTKHDVFIMDDIQSLARAEKSRDIFFEIIANFLDKPGSQLILASDVPPGNLKNFNPRLVSRFGSGLCREIYPPSTETRAAIALAKCKEFGIDLPHPIIDYIANNIRSSVREIEGAIKTLKSNIELTGQMITVDEASKLLSNLVNVARQVTSIDNIKERVAKEYGVTVDSMVSAKRSQTISQARAMAMTLAHDLMPTLSLTEIARSFSKDHSSVHEAIKRTRSKIDDESSEQSQLYHKLVLSLKKD